MLPMMLSFNPCCVGSVASTRDVADEPDESDKFQSLLCWIGRVNVDGVVIGTVSRSCFNPCCVGSVASTGRGHLHLHYASRVSILVVLDRSRQHRRRYRP